jgi:hypothetical protein
MNGRIQHLQLDLPESVRRQLDGFARRLRLVETAFAVLGAAAGLLAAYFLLFVSDRVWDTPTWLRLVLTVAGTISVAAFAAFWGRRWVWRRRDTRAMAGMVQARFPRLGDRLLGIVELADEEHRPPNVSPALCRAAMQQVAAEATALDFQQAVPTRDTRKTGLVVLGLGGVLLAVFIVLPAAGVNAWQRWLRPLAAVPRYTLVQLDRLASQQIVPYGEEFEVSGHVQGASRWLPGRARGRFANQSPLQAPIEAGSFLFHVPGQMRPGIFSLRIGDARARIRVVPTFRPELTQLRAEVEYPKYLGYALATLDVRNGTAEVVEGSRLALAGQVSRALREATLRTNEPEALTIREDEFAAPPFAVTESGRVTLEWQDTLGLRGKNPFVLKLVAKKDQAALADCRKLPSVVAMLEDEVLEIELVADDDFGVKQLGIAWEGEAGREAEERGAAASETPVHGSAIVAEGEPQKKQLTGKFRFAPQVMNIGPQMVTIHATAVDYYPDREPSQSLAYKIYVLDRAQHAALLQKEFDRLLERLEEIARAEESAHETNQQLHELSPEELASRETAERLAEQQHGEQANAEQLRRLQEDLMRLIKEALRNKSIPESVLREWAKLLETIRPLPSELMPQVGQSLGQAQRDAAKRAQRLAEALAQQKEVLERLMQALKQLNEANDMLQASNFVNRLRQAAGAETEIGGTLQQMLPESAGLSAEQLPAALKTKLGTLQQKQSQTQKKVQYIRDDLGSFVKRARQEKYEDVHADMEKTRVVDELEKLAGLVGDNRSAAAIDETGKWSKQLLAWADLLGKKSDSNAGGSGQGQLSPEAIELMLKLARLRQQEEGLREGTRFLEERKETLPTYHDGAEKLGRIQDALASQIRDISDQYDSPQIAPLLERVDTVMGEAAQLLYKPQTDTETVGAQTEVIELLSSACQGAGSGAGAGQMAALMQLLGLGAGNAGSGSLQGGTVEGNVPGAHGPGIGSTPEARNVKKAGGRGDATLPAEFRDALESYFDAVEQLK